MRISCEIIHVIIDSDGDTGADVEGVMATCGRCTHRVESYGTSEESVKRCLVLMRKECYRKESNFYVAASDVKPNTRPATSRAVKCVSDNVKGVCTVAWNLKATKGNGGDFPKAPAGNHPAVLVALIDMGTQTVEGFQGGPSKEQHRAFMLWELVDEAVEGTPHNHLIGIDMNVSLNEKAKLRKWLEARSGKPIPEGSEYDISQELGKPCLLNVVMGTSGYPKIEGVGGAPKGMKFPKPKRELFSWSLEEYATTGKITLPDWIPYLFGTPLADHIGGCSEIVTGEVKADAPAVAAPAAPVAAPSAPTATTAGPPRRKAATGAAEAMYWYAASDAAEPVKLPLSAIRGLWEAGQVNPIAAEVCLEGKDEYASIQETILESATWALAGIPF